MINEQAANEPGRGYFSIFAGREGSGVLPRLAAELLQRQEKNWPALAEGCAAREKSLLKKVEGGRWQAQIQCNPRRIVSTGAKLDPESLKARPCFLCPQNLPALQEAILYRNNYNVLCNPAPIFPGHLTIASIRHTPQSLQQNLEALLLLADDLGPETTVFYNGPRAGASAPDHLHFQAAPCGLMPIEQEVKKQGRGGGKFAGGVEVSRTEGLARGILVIRGGSPAEIIPVVERILVILAARPTAVYGEEPPLNVFCSRVEEGWRLLLFPRLKGRPSAFSREGEERLVVSPGAVDMGGVVIAPRERDFHVLTAETIAEIYREVAFDDEMTGEVLAEL